jgi:transposase InsO family protein
MRYHFIHNHQRRWPIRVMCRELQVKVSGYYHWRANRHRPRQREIDRMGLIEQIKAVHQRSGGSYGSPRVHQQLQKQGQRCSRRTVEKLMKHQQIRSKRTRRFRLRTTDSKHAHPVASNTLNRCFGQQRSVNAVWVADITYIPTDEGWLYLAAVMDLASRRIIGWSTADHLRAELPLAALHQAIQQRSITPKSKLLHHSDRGVQYACDEYQHVLAQHGIECSMSRRGDCYDNAVMESFFKTFKVELVHHQKYATRKEANASIYPYIELFYNHQRLHSALGYQSPAQYEANAS